MAFDVSTEQPVHPNNPHYAVLDVAQPGGGFTNTGFDGIAVKEGEKYDFSLFTRTPERQGRRKSRGTSGRPAGKDRGRDHRHTVLENMEETGSRAESHGHRGSGPARHYPAVCRTVCPRHDFTVPAKDVQGTEERASRRPGAGHCRHPSAFRPLPRRMSGPWGRGGQHLSLERDHRPLEARKPAANIWRYHQTRGLGYFEYFQFCEDIGAEPLPVVAAGVPCQNSGIGGPSHHSKDIVTSLGQQGGIPMEEMGQYIQDVLDLIEYANGDAKTTRWGRERAKAGHPEPFNLKYIGLGNEDSSAACSRNGLR